MQLDIGLIVKALQDRQTLDRLLSLLVQMPDHDCTDEHLKAVYGQSEPGMLPKDAQKAPFFFIVIEFGRILIVLDDHDKLENEKRERDQDHQDAEEVLEFDVGLVDR